MADTDYLPLAQSLYARRQTAAVIPFETPLTQGWAPSEHICHINVDRWVVDNPTHKAIRGWLVFDFCETSGGLIRLCRFTAHSVVETDDGRRFDITPSQASQRYPFLQHEGTAEEFMHIVEGAIIHIDYEVP